MHQDDLSGRLLAQQAAGGDQWTVVELKALSASGDALWPEKFDSEALARIKANISAQDWAALYQQEPTQEVGSYFKEDWLIPVLDLPPRSVLNVYGASDYAVTSNGGDYTVHVVIGIDPKRRMFLLDLWRQQTSSIGRWSFHNGAGERAAGIYKTRAVSHTPRQSSSSTEHPGADGAGRFVRARPRAVATRPESRAARVSNGQA
jgi:hypothetical protein